MQRVAIGRALVRRPAIYLMDEPLSSLDAKLRADLRLELKRIQQDLGATILYVTHDQIEAMTMANRIGVIDDGRARPGRHAARDLREPERASMSRHGSASRRSISCPADFCPTAGAGRNAGPSARGPSICASPRQRTASATATVDWIEHLGDQNHLHVRIGEHKSSRSPIPDAELAVGRRVSA